MPGQNTRDLGSILPAKPRTVTLLTPMPDKTLTAPRRRPPWTHTWEDARRGVAAATRGRYLISAHVDGEGGRAFRMEPQRREGLRGSSLLYPDAS